MPHLSKILLPFATALALCLALPATAQWGWKDKNGSRVYSDQQPPVGVSDKDIFKRPAGSRAAAVESPKNGVADQTAAAPAGGASAAATAASRPVGAASGLKLSGKDAQLEKKKKEADDAEAAKKKAADQELAKNRAENCERAKRGLSTFQSGVRVVTTNDKGEREIMSDTQRATETKRLQDLAQSECK